MFERSDGNIVDSRTVQSTGNSKITISNTNSQLRADSVVEDEIITPQGRDATIIYEVNAEVS